ncbi:peptidoglycan-binding protein [Streptomyces sp. NPDC089799]|uniref:peptidoglycan-binding domain-containing protein n=1 Tax=Streptomyces sp. NPDC089799 TaxID=3155066 RepID=UPI00344932B2
MSQQRDETGAVKPDGPLVRPYAPASVRPEPEADRPPAVDAVGEPWPVPWPGPLSGPDPFPAPAVVPGHDPAHGDDADGHDHGDHADAHDHGRAYDRDDSYAYGYVAGDGPRAAAPWPTEPAAAPEDGRHTTRLRSGTAGTGGRAESRKAAVRRTRRTRLVLVGLAGLAGVAGLALLLRAPEAEPRRTEADGSLPVSRLPGLPGGRAGGSSPEAGPSGGPTATPTATATPTTTPPSASAPSPGGSAGGTASPPAKPKASRPGPPEASGTLRLGATGAEVSSLQQLLFGQGFTYVSATGVYDKDTQRGVRQFQRDRDLHDDPSGVFGPATRKALGGP